MEVETEKGESEWSGQSGREGKVDEKGSQESNDGWSGGGVMRT